MLEAYDAFRLTKHVYHTEGKTTIEAVLERYCKPMPLHRGYSIYVLKTVNDSGTCVFLRDNLCGIHGIHPRTCRLYPFCVGPDDGGNGLLWCLCTERKEHFGSGEVTARQWQRKFLPRMDTEILQAEFAAVQAIGKLMRMIPDNKIDRAEALALMYTYFLYDIKEPFLPQYVSNMGELIAHLKKLARCA